MSKIWKVAVVGCGSFANSQYFPNISKEANAKCVAAVDIVYERAEKACEDFNIPNSYKDVYELIEKCDFDIVIDAASIQAHHEINMAVLNAGKHLVSQKPAAPTVEELTEQIELARKKGVKFACAPIHPMRYDLNTAKAIMNTGALGDCYYARCNMAHGGPEYYTCRIADPSWFYEPGAGALVDMGVHGLQIVTTIFGPAKRFACMGKVTTPVREVISGPHDGKLIHTKLPDQYLITLDFGDNKMALVDTGFSQKATKAPQLEIFGDKGTASFTKYYMTNPEPEIYLDAPDKGLRGWVELMSSKEPAERLISQCCILRDLIRAIENDTIPVLSAEHARHILEIMCKVPEAIETGITMELETTF